MWVLCPGCSGRGTCSVCSFCACGHVNVCLCGCSPSKGPSSSAKKDDDGEEIIISEECTDSALLLLERLSRDEVGARGLAEQAMCSEPVVECVAVAWWWGGVCGESVACQELVRELQLDGGSPTLPCPCALPLFP